MREEPVTSSPVPRGFPAEGGLIGQPLYGWFGAAALSLSYLLFPAGFSRPNQTLNAKGCQAPSQTQPPEPPQREPA